MVEPLSARQRAKALVQFAKNSLPVRLAKMPPHFLAYRRNAPQAGGALVIDLALRVGMGALMAYAVRVAKWAQDEQIAVTIRASTPLYGSGEDVFPTYFQRPASAAAGRPISPFAREWVLTRKIPPQVPDDEASRLFAELFTPSERLQQAIDDVCGQQPFDLSIHFRGTDKYLETGRVGADAIMAELAPRLRNARRVFLATDDAAFGQRVRDDWPDVAFVSYDLGEVAPGRARHFSKLPPSSKALEALVNMYALARAPVCVRTMSYLSSFCRLINPSIETVTINGRIEPGTPFPERQLLDAERQRGRVSA